MKENNYLNLKKRLINYQNLIYNNFIK